MGVSKGLKIVHQGVKLSAKEIKWTSSGVRTHPTFLETLIKKYDFGPVKLSGLWRNGPLGPVSRDFAMALWARKVSPTLALLPHAGGGDWNGFAPVMSRRQL